MDIKKEHLNVSLFDMALCGSSYFGVTLAAGIKISPYNLPSKLPDGKKKTDTSPKERASLLRVTHKNIKLKT